MDRDRQPTGVGFPLQQPPVTLRSMSPTAKDSVRLEVTPLASVPGIAVDYARLIDLTLRKQYEELRRLLHTVQYIAATHDRQRHVVQYAMESRTALMKLLVLLRWKNSADADQTLSGGELQGRVSLAPGLDQWQDQQNFHNREVRNQLNSWSNDLRRFQLHKPDLGTAINLETIGETRRLPLYLKDGYAPAHRLSTQERLQAMNSMNRLISYRVLVEEDMPDHFEIIGIHDGKLYLRAGNLLECAFTLGAHNPRQQWMLVDLTLVSKLEVGQAGSDEIPHDMPDHVKAMLCESINHVLHAAFELDSQSRPANRNSGLIPRRKTFQRVLATFQLLLASHQLETLHRQARQLQSTGWATNLHVSMAHDRKSFDMMYWPKSALREQNPQEATRPMSYGGIVTVRIAPRPTRNISLIPQTVKQDSHLYHVLEVERHSQSDWLGVSTSSLDLPLSAVFELGHEETDVESILIELVQAHAIGLTTALKAILDEKFVLPGIFNNSDIALHITGLGSQLQIRLYGERWLSLQINIITGRLHIGESEAAIASAVQKRLATSARLANVFVEKLFDIIINTRIMLVQESLEEKLLCLGVASQRKLGVSSQELDMHNLASSGPGQTMKNTLVIGLPADPSKSLLFVLHVNNISLAIVHFTNETRTVALANSSGKLGPNKAIRSLEWLDVERLPLSLKSRPLNHLRLDPTSISSYHEPSRGLSFDLGLTDIAKIFSFCSRMVISHLIAKQLLPSRTRPISEGTQNAIGLLNSETYATVKMSCAFEMDLQELLPADEILSLLASPLKVQVIPAVIGSPVKNYKVVAKLHLASWISALTKHQSVPECINDETGLLTGSEDWSMRLISRSSSSVISIETTDIVDYTYGLRLRLSRIRSTLALLVQAKKAVKMDSQQSLRLTDFGLYGVCIQYSRDQSLTLCVDWEVSTSRRRAKYRLQRLSVEGLDSQQDLQRRVTSELQRMLDDNIEAGSGLSSLFKYAQLLAPWVQATIDARRMNLVPCALDLRVLSARRLIVISVRADQPHAIVVDLLTTPDRTGWESGYLMSDAAPITANGEIDEPLSGISIQSIQDWPSIVREFVGRAEQDGSFAFVALDMSKRPSLAVRSGEAAVGIARRVLDVN